MKTSKRIDINQLLASPAYNACSSRGSNMGRRNIYNGLYRWEYMSESGKRSTWRMQSTDLDDVDKRLHLQHVSFVDGGYDRGGAYWGYPSDLYCAFTRDEQTMIFVRGRNREQLQELVLEELQDVLGEDHGFTFIVKAR